MSNFDEKKHPRDSDGKFTDGNRQSKRDKSEKTAEAIRKYSDDPKRDMEYSNLPSAKKIVDKYESKVGKIKMTPEQKISSVHIDFSRDNILPELNDDTIVKLGVNDSKAVLLKGSVIKRNLGKHIDVSEETMQNIVTEALYNPIDVFPANPNNPNYYHLASFVEVEDKNGLKMGLVLLDTDVTKENFEIGHAYFVDAAGFESALNKAKKKD